MADNPLGPFRYLTDTFLVGNPANTLYSGKLVQALDGTWKYMAFRNFDQSGTDFIGDIIDPLPVTVAANGPVNCDARQLRLTVVGQ